MDGNQQYLGTFDNKHAISRACVASIEDYVVDCDLLQKVNVPIDLWRVMALPLKILQQIVFISYCTEGGSWDR